MQIQLHSQTTLAALSDAFAKVFPYLKLEFYTQSHHTFEGSPAQYLIREHGTALQAINPDFAAGALPIQSDMPVKEFERLLAEKFGLFAQVLRHSGSAWLVTTATDGLSLGEQNVRGQEASNRPAQVNEPIDYREQD